MTTEVTPSAVDAAYAPRTPGRGPRPTTLGQPCWTADAVGRSITSVARLDKNLTHYFLATHAPVARIRDETRRVLVAEHDVFARLLDPSRSDVLMIVHGEPGTGKSHLIRWLHLRCQYEQAEGRLETLMPVLVQRRTGSLKDALEQIVDQLPAEFAHHLDRVRDAIGTLSADAARAKLTNELQVELGANWTARGHAPRPAELQALDETCLSTGFRTWLMREGGVIDRTVRQLTEQSDVTDRLHLPAFTTVDFEVPAALQANNTVAVQGLIDELEFTPELRAKAAEYFNRALRPAIKEMSGLGGARLRDVFAGVRRDLKAQGKDLAVFIEDVSVMAALDEDILNAVEPDPKAEFCRLVAVVGMTEVGLRRVRDNQLSRATDFLSLGGDVLAAWREDRDAVARFAARYLNIVRLEEAGVREVAARRQGNSDVTTSACDGCPVMEVCHATFGSVSFGEAAVGLFPFTTAAPQRFLTHLDEQRRGVRQNARGLLEHVLRPVLADSESLDTRAFPRARLAVDLSVPVYWYDFEHTYCGGWSEEDRARLRLLAQGWITADTADAAAQALTPLLRPLGFGSFTSPTLRKPGQPPPSVPGNDPPPPPPPSSPPPQSQDLQMLLDNLDAWKRGQRLDKDDEPRTLVHDLLRSGIPWEEERVPAHVISALMADKRYVRFENQRSNPIGLFVLDLPRNEATAALVAALGRFKYLGGRTWEYRRSEVDKRTVSRWLRQNRSRVVAALQPAAPLTTEAPIAHAVRTLSVAAVLRRGSGLPPDSAGLLCELLSDADTALPVASLSPDDEAAVARVQNARVAAKEFVVKELNRPQGTGGILFIDPIPILAHARRTLEHERVDALDPEYTANGRYWKSRYVGTAGAAAATADLGPLLDTRRVAIKQGLRTVQLALVEAGLGRGKMATDIAAYGRQMAALIDAQKTTVGLSWPDLPALRQALEQRADTWAALLPAAKEVADGATPLPLLTFAAEPFRAAVRVLEQADLFFRALDREVTSQEAKLNADGDPVQLFEELRNALMAIADEGEANDDGANEKEADDE